MEVKVMGIVDANIPYGGYDTLFIPLEMLSKIVPIDNLNYQFIVDTDDSKWAAAKDEIQKIIPPTSSLYVSTLNDWVEAYNEKTIELSYASLHFYYVYWGFWHYQSAKHTDNKHLDTEARIGCFGKQLVLSSKQLSKNVIDRGPVLYIRGVASFHIMRNSYRLSSLHRL